MATKKGFQMEAFFCFNDTTFPKVTLRALPV